MFCSYIIGLAYFLPFNFKKDITVLRSLLNLRKQIIYGLARKGNKCIFLLFLS
jgi:hypothetical protein